MITFHYVGFEQNEISGITQYLFGKLLANQWVEFCNQTENLPIRSQPLSL